MRASIRRRSIAFKVLAYVTSILAAAVLAATLATGYFTLEFARARLEMKAVETVLHLRRERPRRMRHMIPAHVWALVKPYGLGPRDGEQQH